VLQPKLPSYDIRAWEASPFPERLKGACQAWAADGYGTPLAIYLLYVIKIALYVLMWVFFCTFTPGYEITNISSWWASPEAFQKAILWTMLFEGLGLGCGSGPLTGRYVPPIGGALYFLRPGTTKLSLVPGAPVIGGCRRTMLDVGVYAAMIGSLLLALTAPAVTPAHVVCFLVGMTFLVLTDKMMFLVFRSEVYLSVAICLMFSGDWIPGS